MFLLDWVQAKDHKASRLYVLNCSPSAHYGWSHNSSLGFSDYWNYITNGDEIAYGQVDWSKTTTLTHCCFEFDEWSQAAGGQIIKGQ